MISPASGCNAPAMVFTSVDLPCPLAPRMPIRCPARTERLMFCTMTARSEEHTSELQSLMRISYAVFCLKKKKSQVKIKTHTLTVKQTSIHYHNTKKTVISH